RAQFFIGVPHLAEIAKSHVAAIWQGNGGFRQRLHISRIAECADRLFAIADFTTATAEIGIGGAQLAVHVGGGDAVGIKPRRIEFYTDFPIGAAVAVDAANAALALESPFDGVIDKP